MPSWRKCTLACFERAFKSTSKSNTSCPAVYSAGPAIQHIRVSTASDCLCKQDGLRENNRKMLHRCGRWRHPNWLPAWDETGGVFPTPVSSFLSAPTITSRSKQLLSVKTRRLPSRWALRRVPDSDSKAISPWRGWGDELKKRRRN